MQDLLEKAEKQANLTIGILASVIVVILSILLKLIFGGKKPVSAHKNIPLEKIKFLLLCIYFRLTISDVWKIQANVVAETKKTEVAESSDDQGSSETKDEKIDDGAAAAPRRRTQRRDD